MEKVILIIVLPIIVAFVSKLIWPREIVVLEMLGTVVIGAMLAIVVYACGRRYRSSVQDWCSSSSEVAVIFEASKRPISNYGPFLFGGYKMEEKCQTKLK